MSWSSQNRMLGFVLILFLSVFGIPKVKCVAVMSIDLGMEWMKVALVSPGQAMEIVLNKESKRKTPVAVAFRGEERTFGEDALNVGVRSPSLCYAYFLDLLGKDINNPMVKLFQKRFPYYNIVPDPNRNTVLFKHDNETHFSPEELVAMLLSKAREFAVEAARQTVNDVVLTVPGYFNQAERKAMKAAAEIAGLKVLQLINDYTAAALNYGIFRRKDFNETAQYVMFYDMGAYSTSATIVSYQLVKTKEKGYVETNPQLSVIGVGYDRTLGGLEKQMRLRNHLAKKFNEMKKTKKNVLDNPRSVAKLFKEAGRLKLILSANQEYYAQIEGLIDEIDFKVLVQREEFEKLCGDLFDQVKSPVERALKNAQLSLDVINHIILVGAGTRVPAVQDRLSSFVKTELGKNLNTDEAAVMGAAYKAADLSTGFKVKKFITKDAVLFPIQVTFERGDNDKESKLITRTLFNHMNPYPQKKILTFNKHQHDFEFLVQYGDLESGLPEHEIAATGAKLLHKVKLNGVADAIAKHKGNNIEPKGIKTHFNLDESGILKMTASEYHAEKTLSPEEQAANDGDDQSTFSKLSSTFTKLFKSAEEEIKETNPELKMSSKPILPDDGEESSSEEDTKPIKEEAPNSDEIKVNGTDKADNKSEPKIAANETGTNGTAKEVERIPKVVLIKETIAAVVDDLAVRHPSGDLFEISVKKIKALDEFDELKSRRESALNALESAVIDTRSKIEDEEFASFAKPEEAENLNVKSQEISNWLEEEGYSAQADVLETKLSELKSIMEPIQHRYMQYVERPEVMKVLDQTLNSTSTFLTSMKNFTKQLNETTDDPQYTLYTTVEIETLENMINDTIAWKEITVKEQESLKRTDEPVLNIRSISEKIVTLDREMSYLANKSKNWRAPPKKDKTKKKSKKKSKSDEKDDNQEEKPIIEETTEEKVVNVEPQEPKPTPAEEKEDKHTEL